MVSKSAEYFEAIKQRRSVYTLTDKATISDEDIVRIVQEAVKHTPSAFNSQTSRAVVLFKDNHKKLWDITKTVLKAIVPAEQWSQSEARLNGFQGAYATVLFYEDQEGINGMQVKYDAYKERFPHWAEQSSGIVQHTVWTALALEGMSASLQHYNPLIDQQCVDAWGIPKTWQMIAQMPIGKPASPPGNKEFSAVETRVLVKN